MIPELDWIGNKIQNEQGETGLKCFVCAPLRKPFLSNGEGILFADDSLRLEELESYFTGRLFRNLLALFKLRFTLAFREIICNIQKKKF